MPKGKVCTLLAQPGKVCDWLRVNWAVVPKELSLRRPKANGCEQLSVLLMSSWLEDLRTGRRSRVGCSPSRPGEMGAGTELGVRLVVSRTATHSQEGQTHQETRNSYQEPDSWKIRQGLLETESSVDSFSSSCNNH